MEPVVTRTGPLTRGEAYVYDANGNLPQVTDRKNQVTTYSNDAMGLLSTVAYARRRCTRTMRGTG